MPEKVDLPLQPNPKGPGRMNFYVCQLCGEKTVTVHREEEPGVTPFILRCLATPDCDGSAFSQFYPTTIPDPAPEPHAEWFRPTTREGLRAALEVHSRRMRPAIREHFDKGGSFLRPVSR